MYNQIPNFTASPGKRFQLSTFKFQFLAVNLPISNFKVQLSTFNFLISNFLTSNFITLLLLSCSPKSDHQHNVVKEVDTYTCPMHPQVVSDKPGSCPICKMDLVKVNKSESFNVMLNDTQVRLANISTQKVSRKSIGQTIAITGKLTADEQTNEVISTRAAGRIEKLFVKEPGLSIRKGEPLYTLYSETIMTLQQEYLLAKEQYETLGQAEARYKSFYESSEKKLLLYGLTKNQVAALTKQNIQPRITFLSPASGIATEISASEGQYVPEGALLYKIENVNNLWVEAELYPDETTLIKSGDKVAVRVNGDDNAPIEATVNFLSPEYRSNTQIVVMRSSVENKDSKYKPGQQVQVYLTHSSKTAVAIPVDAVIHTGKGAHLYRQIGKNTYTPVKVETGIETFDEIEITSGINEGDTVVVSGAYLLYSELILKKGIDPMMVD